MATINEHNKTIAIYCGAQQSKIDDNMLVFSDSPGMLCPPDFVNGGKFTGTISIFQLRYHESWDWLMPVFKKVTKYAKRVDGNYEHGILKYIRSIEDWIIYHKINYAFMELCCVISEIKKYKKLSKKKHEQKNN